MDELLKKISSYNLFNYLMPGVLFAILASFLTDFSFGHENIIFALFLYYFFGLVISRVGSLVLEPLLKKTSFIQLSEHEQFLDAEKHDEKIEVLLTASNTYRTLSAMFLLLGLLMIYEFVTIKFEVNDDTVFALLLVLLLGLFIYSYRKQTQYVKSRVELISKK